jgi:hypothetical protein
MKRRLLRAGAAMVAIAVLVLVWRKDWVRRQATGEIEPDRAGDDPDPGAMPQEKATFYRRQAVTDCSRQKWNGCLWDLDRARELDPAGDAERGVQATRARAEQALGIHRDALAPPPDHTKGAPPPIPRQGMPQRATGTP